MKYLEKNDRSRKRIEDVAERLHREAEELKSNGKRFLFIPHDVFSSQYFRDGVPRNTLEQKIWVEKRSNFWKDGINAVFDSRGYPEYLFAVPTRGVRLETGSAAASRLQRQVLKKSCSGLDRQRRRLLLRSESYTGKDKRSLERSATLCRNAIVFMAGEIATDSSILKIDKAARLEIVRKYVPEEE